jgi:RpiR family transcriptional regulator, carbohydrate utilization regulator
MSRMNTRFPVLEVLDGLDPHRKELVRPILENPRNFVLLSLRKMAHVVGCHPSTLLRIFRDLGFSGYHEFQRFLHEQSVASTTSLDLVEDASATKQSAVLSSCIQRDVENLRILRESINEKRVLNLAERMYAARRIMLFGGDLASTLTGFLHHALLVIDLPSFLSGSPGHTAYLSRHATRQDLVIAISFRRNLQQTVDGLVGAKAHGAYCVGLTDNFVSPIARYANESFIVSTDGPSLASSYVAPMAFLNMLLVACATVRKKRTIRLLRVADQEQRTGSRWALRKTDKQRGLGEK